MRVPLRVSWAAAGGVAGAKRALPKGCISQDRYGISLYSGPAWPPLPSGRLGPSCMHIRAASTCIADRVCVHVVCLRACAGAGAGAVESHEEIAPARIDHAYTRSSSLQMSHTGYR